MDIREEVSTMARWLAFFLALVFSGAVLADSGANFTLMGLDGKKHSLSDYRGKWVVVNYWATWCPPCREEMPDLVQFHDSHKNKDAVVLGVNMEDTTRENLLRFVDDYFISYPILRNETNMVALGPITGLPTTYLVAPDGKVAGIKVGPVTREGIESFIASQKKVANKKAGK
jgi:thiol-disulfide isomerase/thioredoxin